MRDRRSRMSRPLHPGYLATGRRLEPQCAPSDQCQTCVRGTVGAPGTELTMWRIDEHLPAALRADARIGRSEYWTRMCLLALGGVLLRAVGAGIASLSTGSPRYAPTALSDLIGILTMLGYVLLNMLGILLLFLLATGFVSTVVGRLHDRGQSGWRLVLYGVLAFWLVADRSLWHGAAMTVPLAAGGVLLWGLFDLGVLPGVPAARSDEPG